MGMMMRWCDRFSALLFLLCGLLFSTGAWAEPVALRVALMPAGGQQYFVDLLQQSLTAAGHEVKIEILPDIPQKRLVLMLEESVLSLAWLVQSPERDATLIPVEVGITQGLIGHRILLIPKGDQYKYQRVDSLDSFRQLGLTGAFGKGWFDVDVWRHNHLKYEEQDGDWQAKVYAQVAARDRGVHYFSRGFFEILEEANAHPELDIEPRLMLVYPRDFRFYLSKDAKRYKGILEASLIASEKNGLMDQLIRKHWSEAFEVLKPNERVQIPLDVPAR